MRTISVVVEGDWMSIPPHSVSTIAGLGQHSNFVNSLFLRRWTEQFSNQLPDKLDKLYVKDNPNA
jgi:hypothetical protein